MSTFIHAVQDFVSAYYTQSPQELPKVAQTIIKEADNVNPEECTWALLSLVEFTLQDAVPQKMIASWVCGYLMLRGGSTWVALGPLMECLQEVLQHGAEFVRECRSVLGVAPEAPLTKQDIERATDDIAKTKPELFWAYTSVMPVLGVALPLVDYFQEARVLLRSNEHLTADCESLRDHQEPVKDLVAILERKAQDDADAVPAGTRAANAITKLGELAATPDTEVDAFEEARQAVVRGLLGVPLRVRNAALQQLAGIIEKATLRYVGELIYVCGSIVETGGGPEIALDVALGRFPEILDKTNEFLELCGAAAELDGKEADEMDAFEVVQTYASRVLEKQKDADAGWQTIGNASLGIIALLSRSVEARQRVCRDEALPLSVSQTLVTGAPQASFLSKMLQVLDDEELLILAPEQQRGWKVQIRGVADNFQLHTLIAGTLVGDPEDGWMPGLVGVVGPSGEPLDAQPDKPLDARMTGVSRYLPFQERQVGTVFSHLTLWTWRGLRADGKLPENAMQFHELLVYGEGTPADIPHFETVRVVLLGPSSFSRSWNGGRTFSGMKADLRIVQTLTTEDVQRWVRRIVGNTTDP